jgi:tol-pal system protein YbgF
MACASVAQAQETTDRQLMYQLLQRMDTLEREVRQLRGEQEVLQYKLQQAEDRAQKRSADTNTRLQRLEGVSGAAPSATGEFPQSAAGAPSQPGGASFPTARPPGQPVVAGPPLAGEQAAYDQAFGRLREGAFSEAVDGFQGFLERYPNGELAPNAQYWLGEAHYVNRDFEQARAAFEEVIERYPSSGKVADALLKLGFTLQELGETAAARSTLQDVVKTYPDSPVSRLAERRLQEMGG